jgi:hypothetical protein
MRNPIAYDVVEISRLSLMPTDVLVVKIFADDCEEGDLAALKDLIKKQFPNNKIMLFSLPSDGRMEMDILDVGMPKEPMATTTESPLAATAPAVNLSASPTAYCSSCSCGKKEAIEGIGK